LMFAIALGSIDDVKLQLEAAPDLSARDSWSRTPWLLSLQTGDISKASVALSAGANRSDRGHCGKPPLMYPLVNRHAELLRWLVGQGFDLNDTDNFGTTPLMEAAERGDTQCVRALIDAGADINRGDASKPLIKRAANLDIVRMLVKSGADLGEISDEMRAALTGLAIDGKIKATRDDFVAAKDRRFGRSNPELLNLPFWKAMVGSGAIAYRARETFPDEEPHAGPIWCFRRFGKSITELPDGRIIEIAGEHEDSYDPDFCIYNDVIVHHGDGTFDIYGYPKECFPPTDFHTATLVGNYIYLIGNLGYPEDRKHGETPVYRLETSALEMEKVATSGVRPGWISRHKATRCGHDSIRISGGKIWVLEGDVEKYEDNENDFVLHLGTFAWSKVT